jgi:hypothetical protein
MVASRRIYTERPSRVGTVALYALVLTVVVAKYRKWPFSPPRKTKTPQPIKAKICGADYVGGTTKVAKVHNDRRGIAARAPHMGEVVDWQIFFPVICSASVPHILYTNRRSFGQGCDFGASHRYASSHGAVAPKTVPLIFGTSKGISG